MHTGIVYPACLSPVCTLTTTTSCPLSISRAGLCSLDGAHAEHGECAGGGGGSQWEKSGGGGTYVSGGEGLLRQPYSTLLGVGSAGWGVGGKIALCAHISSLPNPQLMSALRWYASGSSKAVLFVTESMRANAHRSKCLHLYFPLLVVYVQACVASCTSSHTCNAPPLDCTVFTAAHKCAQTTWARFWPPGDRPDLVRFLDGQYCTSGGEIPDFDSLVCRTDMAGCQIVKSEA